MRRLFRLFRRTSSATGPEIPWLERLPVGDPSAREEELGAAREIARRLHAHPRPVPGFSRRMQAVLHAARRRRADELAEAVRGLDLALAFRLAEALAPRADLDREGLSQAARKLAASSPNREETLAALALLSLSPSLEDLPLLERAALSPCGAPAAARAASALPDPRPALATIVRRATGLGRALAIEELLRARGEDLDAEEGARLLGDAAGIADPLDRAWASAPLLEALDAPALLRADPSLVEAVILCLESNARGGWRGGPGPGLGRLGGSIRAAEAILEGEWDREIRERTARAVLDAHPAPAGKLLRLATSLSGA
jgi:hypothetical protein